jgi:TonB family protein
MGAAEPADNSARDRVAPLERSDKQQPPTPVYAQRDESEATGMFDLEGDVRGWSSQLAQWLVIFAVIGIVIGGTKWWSARQGAAIARLAEASPPTFGPAQRPDVNAPTAALTASGAPTTVFDAGDSVAANGDPADTSPAAMIPPAPSAEGAAPEGEPAAGQTNPPDGEPGIGRTINAPTLRAPADVPYPQRLHDVTPEAPAGASVQRGIAVLSLLIDTDGNVADVELLRGLEPALDQAAITAAWQWKFEPTVHDGRRVAVRSNFTVRFGY